jgi:hypothetical protein
MPLGEWLLAVYLGAAHTVSAPLSFPSVAFPAAHYRGESWTPPLYYGYRFSCFPRSIRPAGIEAEFTHLKVYANLPPEGTVQRFSMSHGLNLVLVNVAARRTLRATGAGPLRLTARAGAGPTIPHIESTIGGVSKEGYQLGSIALHAGAGLEIPVAQHVSVVAEYKLTRTHEHVDVAGGTASGVFLSHHAIVGLTWRSR